MLPPGNEKNLFSKNKLNRYPSISRKISTQPQIDTNVYSIYCKFFFHSQLQSIFTCYFSVWNILNRTFS